MMRNICTYNIVNLRLNYPSSTSGKIKIRIEVTLIIFHNVQGFIKFSHYYY